LQQGFIVPLAPSGQSLQAATPAQHPSAHEQQNRLQLVPQSLPLPMILNRSEGFS